MPESQPSKTSSDERPTWHRIYYVLAAFDILALAASLYLNHRIMAIYVDSVETNRQWVEILRDASDLSELAATLNAPANDVFQSNRIDDESAKLEQAYAGLTTRLAAVTAALRQQPSTDRIESMLEDLRLVRSAASQMVRDATLTFTFLSAKQPTQATQYMASMDRRYSSANSALARLRAGSAACKMISLRHKLQPQRCCRSRNISSAA